MKSVYSSPYDSFVKHCLKYGLQFYIDVSSYRSLGETYYFAVYDKEATANSNTIAIWKVTPKNKPQN